MPLVRANYMAVSSRVLCTVVTAAKSSSPQLRPNGLPGSATAIINYDPLNNKHVTIECTADAKATFS